MNELKRISTQQAKAIIEQKDTVIIDIRDAMSFNQSHIEGAVLLDNNNVDTFIENTPKDISIIVYCYHGNSSQGAAQFLHEKGFCEAYSLDGGFELWKTQYDVVS